MPSPFPGMDPYIEAPTLWSDFHSSLAYEIRVQLNPLIQPDYFARLTPYVTYESIEIGKSYGIRPDVGVLRVKETSVVEAAVETTTATPPEPVESRVAVEVPLRLHRVEIRQTGSEELVTVIEILSRVNKQPGHDAYRDYLRKRRDLLRAPVHLLEIDLLRQGQRPPLEEAVPDAPYYVTLSREQERPKVLVRPIQLANLLPTVPVPLHDPDPDVSLNLQEAVVNVYERGAYASQIDYQQPPPPPKFSDDEAAWIEKLLGSKT